MAPEYAKSGLLNEKSDVYSFGVVLLEAITGREPVDYGRPTHEVLTGSADSLAYMFGVMWVVFALKLWNLESGCR